MVGNNIIGFDFLEFSKSSIDAIDAVRMRKSDYETNAKGNPGAAVGVEPRINAFFRMIGFQGYYNNPKDNKKGQNAPLEEYVGDRKSQFAEREDRTRENKKLTKEEQIMEALNSLEKPYCPSADKRLVIPFVWVADNEVSQNKRIADPYEKERVGFRLRRPLIESIIEIKINRFGSNKLPEEVSEYFDKLFKNYTPKQNLKLKQILNNTPPSDYSVLYPMTLANFDLVADYMAEMHLHISKEYSRLKSDGIFIPDPTIVGGPDRKNNNMSSKYINASFSKLDDIIKTLEVKRDLLNSIISVVFNNNVGSGVDAKAGSKLGFIQDSVFMSSIISIMSADLHIIDNKIKKIKEEKKRIDVEIEKIRMKMDFLYGTTTGISMIDVFCILWTLFELEPKILLGLLSDQQFEDYKSFYVDLGYKTVNEERSGIAESYTALEELFKENFNIMREKIDFRFNNTRGKR